MKMKPSLSALTVTILLAGLTRPAAQTPTTLSATRPSDAIVPGPPEAVSLDLPANTYTAYNAIVKVLDAAGLRYGIERPPAETATVIDLARGRDDVVSLGARRVGEALDLIVKAAPQYRWSDRDGLIVVRSTPPGTGILDRRVARFTLTNASPRLALEHVMVAIDPARPRGVGIFGFGRTGTGAGFPPERSGRNVTLSMTDASIESILARIARDNGELSWTVRYDAAPASADNASITMTELSADVVAQSPYAQRTQDAPGALPPNRLAISATLATMVMSYADRNGVRVSVEEVAYRPAEVSGPPVSPQVAGVPPIELPASPAAAIATIVSLDSRYEWNEKNGRFLVRPKTAAAGRLALLDEAVNGFSSTNEPASAVIERAAQLLGTPRPSPNMTGRGSGPSPSSIAMSRPIDINVPAPAVVRDVFDAIADATGWAWSLRPSFYPGRPTTLTLQWRSRDSSGSWGSSLTITADTDLSPPPTPSRWPPVRMAAALDRPVPQLALDIAPAIVAFRQLGMRLRVPMGIEDLPRLRRDDPRYQIRLQGPLTVGPGQFSDALYVVLERLPEFTLAPAEGIVNVAPASLLESSSYFMNRPIEKFATESVGVFRAVGELRKMLDPQFVVSDWDGAGRGTLNKPVTLSLTRATPRAILNEIARQHGQLIWTSTLEAVDATGAPTAAGWVLTLIPIDNAGPAIAIAANGSALAPVPAPQTFNAISIAPGTRPVMLDLPVNASGIRNMLNSAARATGVVMGIEIVSPAVPARPISSEYYNLSGLPIAEMLDKLQQFAPDYMWSLDNGVYHVRPRIPPRDSGLWLGRRIDRLEQRFENMRDALNAVAALGRGSPGAPPGGRRGAPPPLPSGFGGGVASPPGVTIATGPDPIAARMQKTIVLSLTNVTIREILDEIARQHGAMSWTVEQRTGSPGAPLTLTFSTDTWSTGTSVY